MVQDLGVPLISTPMGYIDPGQPLDQSGPSGSEIDTGRISRVKSQKDETSEGATTRSGWLVAPGGEVGGRRHPVQCGLFVQVSSGCRRAPAPLLLIHTTQPPKANRLLAHRTCCVPGGGVGGCRGTHLVPYSTLDPVAAFILRILVQVR